MRPTLYAVLGVDPAASREAIVAAYRRLAMRWHPDRHGEPQAKADAESRFKEIQAAYETLTDETRRARYDASLQPAGTVFEERLAEEDCEDGQDERYRASLPRGAAVKKVLTVPVALALQGGQTEVAYAIRERCPSCAGVGATETLCRACQGTGLVPSRQRYIRWEPCRHCQGRGQIAQPCAACQGAGKRTRQQRVRVRLPAGLVDGSTLTLPRQGRPSLHGGYPGDLLLTIRLQQTAGWKFKSADMQGVLKVPFPLAVLGGALTAALPTGKAVQVQIPPGTNSGKQFKLSGQGLYDAQHQRQGDAILTVQLVLPAKKALGKLTPAEAALLQQWL